MAALSYDGHESYTHFTPSDRKLIANYLSP